MASFETMRARVASCALIGVEAVPVTVEIEVAPGLPNMFIVGLADSAVQEARLRVRSSLRAAGFSMPLDRHIVVNLAPATVKKSGSAFDLPIALAYLVATRQIPAELVEGCLAVGELSLNGAVRPTSALFAYALCARDQGLRLVSGPLGTRMPELSGLDHVCLNRLSWLKTGEFEPPHFEGSEPVLDCADFKDVVGQATAVRALTIAAAGGHGALLVGPPGAGKSMLASRLPSIMPELSEEERIEVALIHSVAGLDLAPVTAGIRPFRRPHHSATAAALVGGGRVMKPGEVSLAHHGVLFLDELGEVSNAALQALRQPIEEGRVVLSRAEGTATFPARFQLLAASNPCPCGFLNDREHVCKCTEHQINRYQTKLGGPLKDRFDLICEVSRVDPARVLDTGHGITSAKLREQVVEARERAQARGAFPGALASTSAREVIDRCELDGRRRLLVEEMARSHQLSGRGIIRILRVARTIADLDQCAKVSEEHLYEAFMYRVENTLE